MPTNRPRHVITETDEVTSALEDAARRWPEDRDSSRKLLLHLVAEGHRAVVGSREQRADDRHKMLAKTSGLLTGVYGRDYLERLREDWPQ